MKGQNGALNDESRSLERKNRALRKEPGGTEVEIQGLDYKTTCKVASSE